jgi:hypothetical protein
MNRTPRSRLQGRESRIEDRELRNQGQATKENMGLSENVGYIPNEIAI